MGQGAWSVCCLWCLLWLVLMQPGEDFQGMCLPRRPIILHHVNSWWHLMPNHIHTHSGSLVVAHQCALSLSRQHVDLHSTFRGNASIHVHLLMAVLLAFVSPLMTAPCPIVRPLTAGVKPWITQHVGTHIGDMPLHLGWAAIGLHCTPKQCLAFVDWWNRMQNWRLSILLPPLLNFLTFLLPSSSLCLPVFVLSALFFTHTIGITMRSCHLRSFDTLCLLLSHHVPTSQPMSSSVYCCMMYRSWQKIITVHDIHSSHTTQAKPQLTWPRNS